MCGVMHSTWGLLAVATLTGVSARAQDTIFFPPRDHVAIRAMRSIPIVDVAPGVHVHTVVGPTGSVSVGDLDSGGVAPLHHHTREQVDVGLAGTADIIVGNHTETLPPGAGVLIPADVNHSLMNRRAGVVTLIEFHTVPRPDLVPPRPTATYPASAQPVALADDRPLVGDMSTKPGKTFTGRACMVRWRWVGAATDVHPRATSTELFVYVARGDVELRAEGRTFRLPEGSLAIIPPGLVHAEMKAVGESNAGLIEFQVNK